ncbi:hypothetical protein BAE44_0015501, partial [Dichanthelium oligosanthes]
LKGLFSTNLMAFSTSRLKNLHTYLTTSMTILSFFVPML